MKARLNIFALLLPMLSSTAAVGAERLGDSLSASVKNLPGRSLSAIQVDLHAALRAEASTRRQGERNTAEVVRLIILYREMAAHPQRDRSVTLRSLELQLRSRLERVRDHIRRLDLHPEPNATAKKGLPAVAVPDTRVLAQQIGVPGGPAPGQSALRRAIQPGAGTTIDYGPDLVDLIQRTISPATWDINGGNGSVVYFAPRQAIVVSAPERVHDQIDDALGQLRAAP